ncbi:MAG: protein phosphatase 2C domain-containing protein [Myxococcota bacterium]
MIQIDAGGLTFVGKERERNEDRFLVASMTGPPGRTDSSPAPATLLIVADGIGGLPHGDLASHTAVKTIGDHIGAWHPTEPPTSSRHSLPGVRSKLASAIGHGHDEVSRAAETVGAEHMGTTLTVAYVSFPALYVAHVGDSRAYVVRGGRAYRLTSDHTLAEELSERMGREVEADSPWHHVLTRALGPMEHGEATPQLRHVALDPDDIVLLCTDGVTKHLSDTQLAETLRGEASSQLLATRVVEQANAAGGTDNITAAVARFRR